MNEYEQKYKEIIAALEPELRKQIINTPRGYEVHGPLMITFGLIVDDPQRLNEQYRTRKNFRDKLLANVRFDPTAYLGFINKPYRFDAFWEIQDKLSDAQYWRALAFVWMMSERIHSHGMGGDKLTVACG